VLQNLLLQLVVLHLPAARSAFSAVCGHELVLPK